MLSHVWTCLWSHSVWSAITFEWHFSPSPLRTIQESVCLPVSSKSSASICTYFKKNKFSVFCCVHRLVSACWASLPSCKNSTLQTSNHYSCHWVQSSPFIPRWAPAVAEQLLFKCLLLVVPPFHFLSSPFSLFFSLFSHLSFPYLSSFPFFLFPPSSYCCPFLSLLYISCFFLSFSLHVIISYTVYSFHFPLSFHLSHSLSSSQLLFSSITFLTICFQFSFLP